VSPLSGRRRAFSAGRFRRRSSRRPRRAAARQERRGGNVAAETPGQRGEVRASAVLQSEHLGIAVGVGEFRVAYPPGDDASARLYRSPASASSTAGASSSRCTSLRVSPKAGPRVDTEVFFPGMPKLVRSDVDVGVLGDVHESLERHMIAQQNPEQRRSSRSTAAVRAWPTRGLEVDLRRMSLGNISQNKSGCQTRAVRPSRARQERARSCTCCRWLLHPLASGVRYSDLPIRVSHPRSR